MFADHLSYENIRWGARAGVAQAFIIFLLLLSLVSFSLPHTDTMKPLFILIPIYYWNIYRPSMIPTLYVFILGLLVDFVLGFPVGLHAALFVILQLILKSQRLFLMGQPYLMLWLGFALVSTSLYALEWLFFSLRYLSFMPISGVFASNVITILLFPVIALILTFIQRILPPVSKSY
jgi:rod shape-determining protein MreD